MIKLLRYFKLKEWLLSILSIGLIVFQVWLDLTMPEYMGKITTLVQTPGSELSEILSAGGMMLIITLGSVATAIVVAFIAANIGASFSARLRENVFNKVQSFSMEEINNFSIASLITRSTNDITQVQMVIIMGIQMLIKSPIMAIWAIVKILNKSWQWSLSTGIAIAVLLFVSVLFIIIVLPKFRIVQSQTDELNRMSRENLTGIRIVRAYNAEKYQEEKFYNANTNLTKTNLFTGKMMSLLMPSVDLIINGMILSIYWIGAVLINNAAMMNKLTIFSDMMVFTSYAVQLFMAFMLLIMMFIFIPRAAVSAKRIDEVLSTEQIIKDGNDATTDINQKGVIEFNNVSFKYPDAAEYVIDNINLKINKGETVAFIGATGCGKSTIINLVPRFYDATAGEVKVDGKNVKDYPISYLRNKIGYVSQTAILFGGTIKSNVAFGEDIDGKPTDTDVINSVKVAQAEDFVLSKEDKYDSFVSPGGGNLSGGQKQRISIARALARKPEILIFDDSFSALDYKTDKLLRSELKNSAKGVTVLIVAQRIGTIKDADKIVVLEDGVIKGIGKHEELLQNCDIYKEIALSQLSKEELE